MDGLVNFFKINTQTEHVKWSWLNWSSAFLHRVQSTKEIVNGSNLAEITIVVNALWNCALLLRTFAILPLSMKKKRKKVLCTKCLHYMSTQYLMNEVWDKPELQVNTVVLFQFYVLPHNNQLGAQVNKRVSF